MNEHWGEGSQRGLLLQCCLVHCTTQTWSKRGLDVGFSSCAVPNYLILMSSISDVFWGLQGFPEVSEVVQEFGSESGN